MADVVQRWRIVYCRDAGACDLVQRAEQEAWEAAVLAADLPVARDGRGRPRLSFGVPLPAGLTALAEPLELPLTRTLRRHEVRGALEPVVPEHHALVDVHDVWMGAPALAGRVVAVDYVVTLEPRPDERVLAAACARLLGQPRIDRVRQRSDRAVAYDLRPFLLDLRPEAGGVRMRLSADPSAGVGRPDEVVAALADVTGLPLAMAAGVRERVVVAGEPA
jgi:hypothetical protein